LRNTLLQSELEKERIALELEEEKKAKEQRDKRLIEQAKKIENLSSMVLNSERDDRSIAFSKDKRRVTWCPGPKARQFGIEVLGPIEEGPTSSTVRNERNMGMPPRFEELIQESYASNDEPCANVMQVMMSLVLTLAHLLIWPKTVKMFLYLIHMLCCMLPTEERQIQ